MPENPRVITDEAKAWVINLACTKLKDQGMVAELWTNKVKKVQVEEHRYLFCYEPEQAR